MTGILPYLNGGFTIAAILVFLTAAFFAVKYLVGFSSGEQLKAKNHPLVLIGGGLMVIASGIAIASRLTQSGQWWDPILLVNLAVIIMAAAVLHTYYHRWDYKWAAWLSVLIIFLDANLRFLVMFFFRK
ncbi:MAG TPA: hypothetical protein VHS59_08325 [Bacillota bacterium]|nr:hypothetical protein [Bacillota bacterium]